jgi:hypothetical protein
VLSEAFFLRPHQGHPHGSFHGSVLQNSSGLDLSPTSKATSTAFSISFNSTPLLRAYSIQDTITKCLRLGNL